ncbi:MAG: hypothetical protein ACOCVR_00510 [Myxococcota bacterium]
MSAKTESLVSTGQVMEQSAHYQSLREVFACWARLNDAASAHGRIAPLCRYTERTHLGLLAAAAWQCRYEAFEEVAIEKGERASTGRCDLILRR